MRILIVDDEPLVGKSLLRALQGYEVDVAESGAEGLALHRKHPYALAYLDCHLPDTTGHMLAKELMVIAKLRCVLIGGGDLHRYRLAGVECLEKPFTREDLRASVAKHLPGAGGTEG